MKLPMMVAMLVFALAMTMSPVHVQADGGADFVMPTDVQDGGAD